MIDILKKEQLVALSFSLCVVTLNAQILFLLLTSHRGFVFFIRSRTAVAPLERMKILLQVCSSLVYFVFSLVAFVLELINHLRLSILFIVNM